MCTNTYIVMKEITSSLISKLSELRSNRTTICLNQETLLPFPLPPRTFVFSLAMQPGLPCLQTLVGRILLLLFIFWSGVQHYSSASTPRTLTNLMHLLASAWQRLSQRHLSLLEWEILLKAFQIELLEDKMTSDTLRSCIF